GGGGGDGGGPVGGPVEETQDGTAELPLARATAERFDDVEAGDYFAAAVGWMLAHNITTGCDANSFCPGRPVTRGQIVTLLWRAAGEPEPQQLGSAIFDDVDADSYADAAIGWAAQAGVTVGCRQAAPDSGAMFCGARSASRAHVAAFLYRYMDADAEPADNFSDVDADGYFSAAVNWMSTHDITTGCRPDMFCPARTATRAQFAAFLYRIASNPRSWGPDAHLSADLAP
ncbi:MAG: S-layer homology domain-containing protein, partial [Acidimicrobiaceae bacterium]|nr:S-layer homology domain-containing protein [Acidimicrobiaceae bacterium]